MCSTATTLLFQRMIWDRIAVGDRYVGEQPNTVAVSAVATLPTIVAHCLFTAIALLYTRRCTCVPVWVGCSDHHFWIGCGLESFCSVLPTLIQGLYAEPNSRQPQTVTSVECAGLRELCMSTKVMPWVNFGQGESSTETEVLGWQCQALLWS